MATSAAPSGADYSAVYGSPNMQGAGVSDRIRDRLVREEHQRLVRQGWEVATVCSLLPFPLTVNLGELGTIQVPAATPEEPVQRLVINRYRLSMRDLGDGRFTPVSVLPRELAQEVNREFAATGGVFVFNGEDIPADATIAEARERMFAWFRRTYQQAVDSWGRYHQHSMLTDRMRDAAHALFRTGEIAALPEWISITRAQADRRDCTMCGESIKVNAKICHFCRTKVTPLAEGE